MMRGSERSEAQTENVAVVGAVTHQERAVRLVGQFRLRLVEPERTPVPPTLPHAHTHIKTSLQLDFRYSIIHAIEI